MITSGVARRYARALFELASEEKQVEPVSTALTGLADNVEGSNELRSILESPRYTPEVKKAVLGGVAQRLAAPGVVQNLIAMLIDRNRLGQLRGIADEFEQMAERAAGRLRAEIISATPLPESYYDQLQKTLSEATGRQVTLHRRQDPSLIGGVVAKVGDTVFDGSIKNRLTDLRHQLLVAAEDSVSQS